MRRRFATADVFTDRLFGGNPVAVVLDAEGLPDAAMQALASEFNLSETTFVLPPRDPAHTARVRIFTPDAFAFEEAAGLVPVRLLRDGGGEVVGAELTAPEPLSRRGTLPPETAAALLSLRPEDVRTDAQPPHPHPAPAARPGPLPLRLALPPLDPPREPLEGGGIGATMPTAPAPPLLSSYPTAEVRSRFPVRSGSGRFPVPAMRAAPPPRAPHVKHPPGRAAAGAARSHAQPQASMASGVGRREHGGTLSMWPWVPLAPEARGHRPPRLRGLSVQKRHADGREAPDRRQARAQRPFSRPPWASGAAGRCAPRTARPAT